MRIVKFVSSFSIMRLAYQEYKLKALFGLPSQPNNGRTAPQSPELRNSGFSVRRIPRALKLG